MIKRLIASTIGPQRSPMADLILGLILFIILAALAVSLYVGVFYWLAKSTLEPLFNRSPEGVLMQLSVGYPAPPAEFAAPDNSLLYWLNYHFDAIVKMVSLIGIVAAVIALVCFTIMAAMALRDRKDQAGDDPADEK